MTQEEQTPIWLHKIQSECNNRGYAIDWGIAPEWFKDYAMSESSNGSLFANYMLKKCGVKAHDLDGIPYGDRQVTDADVQNWLLEKQKV